MGLSPDRHQITRGLATRRPDAGRGLAAGAVTASVTVLVGCLAQSMPSCAPSIPSPTGDRGALPESGRRGGRPPGRPGSWGASVPRPVRRRRARPTRPWRHRTTVHEPATRIVPATAVPSDEPRLDTLRDRPEISPWSSSGKLDWTRLTEGSASPDSQADQQEPGGERPGARRAGRHGDEQADPAQRHDEAGDDQGPLRRLFASRSAASDETRMPSVAAVKITPVSIAL